MKPRDHHIDDDNMVWELLEVRSRLSNVMVNNKGIGVVFGIFRVEEMRKCVRIFFIFNDVVCL